MKRIAVVEDNADNRLLLKIILGDSFTFSFYEEGSAALEGMEKEPPDLVLLDISLPGMDGVEVLRELRRKEALRDLPVIALTAHAMVGDREKYLKAGFNDYVSKPIVDEEAFLERVGRWLS